MRENMNAYDLVREANNVSIELTTKLLVEKALLSRGKSNPNQFLCIHHNDTNPDLKLYRRKNRVKCFVCGTSAKGAELYEDLLIAERFKGVNIAKILDSDVEKLEKSSLDKDKKLLGGFRFKLIQIKKSIYY